MIKGDTAVATYPVICRTDEPEALKEVGKISVAHWIDAQYDIFRKNRAVIVKAAWVTPEIRMENTKYYIVLGKMD